MYALTPQAIAQMLISFAIGAVFGYYLRGAFDRNLSKPVQDYRNVVLIAVTFIWVLSVVFEILNPVYKTNPLIHGLLGGIVAFFFKHNEK